MAPIRYARQQYGRIEEKKYNKNIFTKQLIMWTLGPMHHVNVNESHAHIYARAVKYVMYTRLYTVTVQLTVLLNTGRVVVKTSNDIMLL